MLVDKPKFTDVIETISLFSWTWHPYTHGDPGPHLLVRFQHIMIFLFLKFLVQVAVSDFLHSAFGPPVISVFLPPHQSARRKTWFGFCGNIIEATSRLRPHAL